jgi:prepilin-type N-terminal cleavage/methylation domain-containing protein
MKTILRKQSGFTFIELLIALTLLTTGILAVSSMQIMAIGNNSFARTHTEAYTIAASRIEELMKLDFDDVLLTDTNSNGAAGLDDTLEPDADYVEPAEDHPATYEVYWNIVDDIPMDGTKFIRVIVKYNTHTVFPKTARIDYIINDE